MKSMLPIIYLVFMVFLLTASWSVAGNDTDGKVIHDKQCLGCHGTEMYKRDPLFVKSYRQLDAQVSSCAKRNGIEWSTEEMESVVDYLADDFYGFE